MIHRCTLFLNPANQDLGWPTLNQETKNGYVPVWATCMFSFTAVEGLLA